MNNLEIWRTRENSRSLIDEKDDLHFSSYKSCLNSENEKILIEKY